MLDRFSVCAAYHIYSVAYNGAREANEYAARLRRLDFHPGSNAYNIEGYRDDDRDEVSRIYGDLVMRHNALHVGYERLYRRARGRVRRVYSWPGDYNIRPETPREWIKRRGLLDAVECYTR